MSARARATDPSTSHLAAASVHNISETQARILALYRTFGDLTDPELIEHYRAMQPDYPTVTDQCIRSRRAELVHLGRLWDSGKRVESKTGRHHVVWALEKP